MPTSIRAVQCNQFAGFDADGSRRSTILPVREVLSLQDLPAPTCGPEEILVQTKFAGVQYPDMLQAQGLYQERPELPYTPGVDFSGVVLQVGSGVSHIRAGEAVIGYKRIGALAEIVALEASAAWSVPAGVPLEQCANLSRNYFAAYHSLRVTGQMQSGDCVLIDGASGGVGLAAIQLAKAMGASVIAGVSQPEKRELPLRAGADVALVYGRSQEEFRTFKQDARKAASDLGHSQGVDLIIDMVQGELFESALLSCIRPLGRIVLVGFTAGQVPIRPGMILIKQAIVAGSLWGPWSRDNPAMHRKHVTEILDLLWQGKIAPVVGNTFPLEEYWKAFELYENGAGRGNTVVAFP